MKKELQSFEKIDFLANCEIHNTYKTIKTNQKWTKIFLGLSILPIIVGCAFIPAVASALVLLPASLISSFALILANLPYQANIAEVQIQSNGRLTYKDYKRLLKSGELAKWQEEFAESVKTKNSTIDRACIQHLKLVNLPKSPIAILPPEQKLTKHKNSNEMER